MIFLIFDNNRLNRKKPVTSKHFQNISAAIGILQLKLNR